MYPFLSTSSILSLDSLAVSASGSADADIQYPKTGTGRLGFFSEDFIFAGTDDIVSPDTGDLSFAGGTRSMSLDEDAYGTPTLSGATSALADLSSRRLRFEYAPRALYLISDMGVMTEGIFSEHEKRLYAVDSSIGLDEYNAYDKYLIAHETDQHEDGVFDVRFQAEGVTSDINPGVRTTTFRPDDTIFGSSAPTFHSVDILNVSSTGKTVGVQMLSIPGETYDIDSIRTGFASALAYDVS